MSIGELARLTGLTAKALRHYDRVGLLVPALITADGYRWYGADQAAAARRIARWRALDLPLEAVRAILHGSDDEIRQTLTQHRACLQARDDRIRRSLHALDRLINDKRGISVTFDENDNVAVPDERALAARLFNDTWALLQKERRTPEEDDRMIHMAHASRFHWDNVGDDQNRAIGEWQTARVYSALGRGEAAMFHATRCLHYAERPGHDDWLLASAWEGIARAQAVAGEREAARDSRDKALALLEQIADPEDRQIVAADIDTLPVA